MRALPPLLVVVLAALTSACGSNPTPSAATHDEAASPGATTATESATSATAATTEASATPPPTSVATETAVAPTVATMGTSEAESLVPAPPPAPTASTGTLVAVAVGGNCAFSVNGASKGTASTLKLTLSPGTYSVTCKPSSGPTTSKSVSVTQGGTAMAMFKLQ